MAVRKSKKIDRWHWIRYQNSNPSSSGDLARNFKNEGRRDLDPGIFQLFPIPNPARFLARESIQNTMDACNDIRFTDIHGVGPVEVIFRFVELTGESKKLFIESASLGELASRRVFLQEGSAAKESKNCLDHLEDETPLRLLYVEEHGASGMYGPWDDDFGSSKLSIAMLSQNISEKPSSAGGAYGHGKSVNAMASKIRVNIAYTCFLPELTEPTVTRRLLGVPYWPTHLLDGPKFTGFALLGDLSQTGSNAVATPWVNHDADREALNLGFAQRSSEKRDQCGTSMLIIDPDINQDDLERAVERYWWPAISDRRLRVQIISPDGSPHPVRPRLNPLLRGFEDAYQAITTPSGQDDSAVRVRETSRLQQLGIKSGDIAMVPATSLGADADDERQTSLVAYVRGLGMVVKYRSLAIGPAFVHGVFLSNQTREIETLLNKCEPKTHYDWLPEPDEPNPETRESIRLLVQNINNSVHKEVRDFSRSITPPEDDRPVRFKDLDKELRDLVVDSGDGPPPPGDRDFSIRRLHPRKKAIGEHQIQVSGKVVLQRTSDEVNQCKFSIRYFLPDEVSRGKPIKLAIQVPPGFEPVESDTNTFIGPCDNEPIEIVWTTPAYDRNWIGELDIEALKHGA